MNSINTYVKTIQFSSYDEAADTVEDLYRKNEKKYDKIKIICKIGLAEIRYRYQNFSKHSDLVNSEPLPLDSETIFKNGTVAFDVKAQRMKFVCTDKLSSKNCPIANLVEFHSKLQAKGLQVNIIKSDNHSGYVKNFVKMTIDEKSSVYQGNPDSLEETTQRSSVIYHYLS